MSKAQTLEQWRQRIEALNAERAALRTAPRARVESEADLLARCKDWEARGAAGIGYGVSVLAFGHKVDDLFRVRVENGMVDMGPVLAHLFGAEGLAAILSPSLDRRGDGPTAAERATQIAEIERQLLAAEIEEERSVMAAEDAGVSVTRRADADPRAVLWV